MQGSAGNQYRQSGLAEQSRACQFALQGQQPRMHQQATAAQLIAAEDDDGLRGRVGWRRQRQVLLQSDKQSATDRGHGEQQQQQQSGPRHDAAESAIAAPNQQS